MTFHNEELPDDIQYGSTSGIGFSTAIQASPLGHEQRSQRASQGRHQFSLVKVLQTQLEAHTLKAFIAGRRGSWASFPLKDHLDYTSTLDGKTAPTVLDQTIGTGDGSNTEFQLHKTYEGSGPNPYSRRIILPVDGTVVVAVDGVATTAFSVSLTTGVITFNSAPANNAVVTAGFEYRVKVRFAEGVDKLAKMLAQSFERWNPDALGCIEEIDDAEWPDRFWPGGSRYFDEPSFDVHLEFGDGTLINLLNTTGSLSMYLPDPASAPSGVFHFTIWNQPSSTQAITLRLLDGTSFKTLAIDSITSLGFARDPSNNVTWVEI